MNIHEFRSKLGPKSLAKSNRFRMVIPSAPVAVSSLQDFSFLISDAVIPGKNLELETFRYYGLSFENPVHVKENPFSITFYVQDSLEQYNFFFDWLKYIYGDGSYDMRFKTEYATEIILEKLSEVGPETVTRTFKFRKAYPTSIQDQPLTWGDDEVMKTTVNFTYQGMTSE